MSRLAKTLVPVLAVLTLSVAGPPGLVEHAHAQAEVCFADWSEAAAIVRREQLATVAELTEQARGRVNGEVLKTLLCKQGGRYHYRLVVRAPGGQLVSHSIDARHPFAAPGTFSAPGPSVAPGRHEPPPGPGPFAGPGRREPPPGAGPPPGPGRHDERGMAPRPGGP